MRGTAISLAVLFLVPLSATAQIVQRAYCPSGVTCLNATRIEDAYSPVFTVINRQLEGSTTYSGWFDGRLGTSSDLVVSTGVLLLSSRSFKQDIQRLRGAGILDRVKRLEPVSFAYRDMGRRSGERPGRHYGLIAEEVRSVFPEVVRDVDRFEFGETSTPDDPVDPTTTTYAAIDYSNLVAILTQALLDQQEQIEALTARVEQLERRP